MLHAPIRVGLLRFPNSRDALLPMYRLGEPFVVDTGGALRPSCSPCVECGLTHSSSKSAHSWALCCCCDPAAALTAVREECSDDRESRECERGEGGVRDIGAARHTPRGVCAPEVSLQRGAQPTPTSRDKTLVIAGAEEQHPSAVIEHPSPHGVHTAILHGTCAGGSL